MSQKANIDIFNYKFYYKVRFLRVFLKPILGELIMPASLVIGLKSLKVNKLPAGTMFSVTTGNGNTRGSKYLFVATSPGRHDAAVFSKSVSIPVRYTLCRIMGSLTEDNLVPGAVSVGSSMYIRDHADVSGDVIQTRPVTGIWMIPLQVHSEMIVCKAERSFAAAIEGVIRKEFSDDRQSCIREMVNNFRNAAGKSAALGALVRGNNSIIASGNKLGAAMEVMQQYWGRYWEAEFPEVAGDPITDLNESRWKDFDQDRDIKAKELVSGQHVFTEVETI